MENVLADRTKDSPWDRGSLDNYYGRKANPHFYVGERLVTEDEMSMAEIEAYLTGYEWPQHRLRAQ